MTQHSLTPRNASARRERLHSPEEMQRAIIELSEEVNLLKRQVQTLSAENSRLREGR